MAMERDSFLHFPMMKFVISWIKAEPTEGLLQTLYEPEERVRIQEKNNSSKSIYTLTSYESEYSNDINHLETDETRTSD